MMWAIFTASLLMGFSGAIMPGPLLTVTINESIREGAIAGPKLILGHAILELLLVILIFFGLGTFFTWPIVKGVIGLVGGLFLIWMGYGITREALAKNISLNLEGNSETRHMNPVFAGVTVSASNPYWVIWWATAGSSSLMLAAANGISGAVSFYSGHILADFLWYTLLSTAIAKGRKLFTPLVYRVILTICGLFLFFLAFYFIYSGVNFFR